MSNDIRSAAVQARDKFARLRAAVDEVLMPIGNMDPDGRMKALTRMTTFHSVAHAGIIKELLDAYDAAALAAAPVPQPTAETWTNERCEYNVCDEAEQHDPKCNAWPSPSPQQDGPSDAEMLDWLTRRIGGIALRDAGVAWPAWSPEYAREAIRAAMLAVSQQKEPKP